jgi:hypothetical protein
LLIEGDPEVSRLLNEMFMQTRPGAQSVSNNFVTFTLALKILFEALPHSFQLPYKKSYIDCPFTDLVKPYISTPAGHKLFVHPESDHVFAKVLREWTRFLLSSDFRSVLINKILKLV